MKLLIVEDERELSDSIVNFLNREPFNRWKLSNSSSSRILQSSPCPFHHRALWS